MSLVKLYNKERDVTYVYESTSYWDKEKKQPRSKRKLIGKIDPETGEIVPTGKRGRKKKSPEPDSGSTVHSNTDYKSLYEQAISDNLKKDADIISLHRKIASLELENHNYNHKLEQIRNIIT